jgi:ribosome-associated protein
MARLALTKKAGEVTVMDLRKVTDMADFFVVCSGDSDTQVKAIADAITDGMELEGVAAWHREGLTERQWVLLDYVDVVVHVFHKEARRFYGIEKLWGDAQIEIVEDTPPEMPAAPPKKAAKSAVKGAAKGATKSTAKSAPKAKAVKAAKPAKKAAAKAPAKTAAKRKPKVAKPK